MTKTDIISARLYSQGIATPRWKDPASVVKSLGAVQAQDYFGSLWAIGLRLKNSTDRDIEKAIDAGTIIRTWPLRGTLHFVTPEDVRWMLEILTPRVIARAAGNYRQAGLDEKTFSKSRKLIEKVLEGGKQLMRTEMYDVLERAKISTAAQRGLHILGRLALEGLICLGSRIGKQPSFVLLDEWVPATKKLHRDEALAKLAIIYFTSRGPATLQDFAWWSGLAIKEAAMAIEQVNDKLVEEVIEKQSYWFSSSSIKKIASPGAHLLPAYDEYTVAYKDRSAVLNPAHAKKTGNGIFSPTIVVDGQIAGTWKRTLQKNSVAIEVTFLGKPKGIHKSLIEKAANQYGKFLSLPVIIS